MIFLAGEVPLAGRIIAAIRAVGMDTPILGPDAMSSPALIAEGREAVEGTVVASFFHPDEPREEVSEFVERFHAAYGVGPDLASALGYDAVWLLASAMRAARTPAPAAVAEALRRSKWRGGLGVFGSTHGVNCSIVRSSYLRCAVVSSPIPRRRPRPPRRELVVVRPRAVTVAERVAVLRAHGAGAGQIQELLRYTEPTFDLSGACRQQFPLDDEPFVAAWSHYVAESARHGTWSCLVDKLVQLRFPIAEGMSRNGAYRAATRQGDLSGAPDTGRGLCLRAPGRLQLLLHCTPAVESPF